MKKTAHLWLFLGQLPTFVMRLAELSILFVVAIFVVHTIAPEPGMAPLLASFLFIPLLLVCVAVHEAGHAIAGVSFGFRIHYIRVFWFLYRPYAKNFAIASRKMQKSSGGAVFATSDAPYSRVKSLFFIGGGPAFSLSLALLFPIADQFRPPISNLLNGLAAMSCIVGIFALIPVRSGDRTTDGAKVLQILFGAPPKNGTLLFLQLLGAHQDGIALRELDASLMARLEREEIDDKYRNARDSMLTNYCFCRGELERAKILLRKNEAALEGSQPELTISYAFLTGLLDASGEQAEDMLRRIPLESRTGFHYFRAWAVAQYLLKRHPEAQEAVNAALRCALDIGATPDEEDRQLFAAIREQKLLPDFGNVRQVT